MEFNITLETAKSIRLGRRSNKPRPLLISPIETYTRRLMLRNAKELRNNKFFKNVFIAPDLTPSLEKITNRIDKI